MAIFREAGAGLGSDLDSIIDSQNNCELYEVEPIAFRKLVLREGTVKVLGILKERFFALEELGLRGAKASLYFAFEGIEKPGNWGAVARSASAAGVDALILIDPKIRAYHPSAIRASTGGLFDIPIIKTEAEVLRTWAQKTKLQLLLATPEGAIDYWGHNFRDQANLLIFGAEDRGLSSFWRCDTSDTKALRIPMNGLCDSLNLSLAAGLVAFERLRQSHKS